MRISGLLLSGAVSGLVAAGAMAHAKQTHEPVDPPAIPAVDVDRLAQRVFADADRNHNHVLNKIESKNAQEMLETAIGEWGRTGLIGKPRRSQRSHTPDPASAVTFSSQPRGNKVTQAEFTFYVHALVDEADQHWRQLNAVNEAERKALATHRRAYQAHVARSPYALHAD